MCRPVRAWWSETPLRAWAANSPSGWSVPSSRAASTLKAYRLYAFAMPITWSRLHELLGIDAPRGLTADDITRAVELDLDEDEALDFKAQLRTVEPSKVELAKDVAAMANSGGGLIVFGVGERGDDKHLTDEPFEIAAEPEHTIQQLLAARVRPIVRPTVEPIRRDSETCGYLLVQVPGSPNAPHFYEHNPDPKNPPGAPYRHGSGTLMMREHDIERAYRERFDRRDELNSRLSQLLAKASARASPTSALGGQNTRWIAVASQPLGSVPRGVPDPEPADARDALVEASEQEVTLQQRDDLHSLLTDIVNDRRSGLRRWIFQYFRPDDDSLKSALQFADLHYDGSVVFAVPIAVPPEAEGGERNEITASLLQVERAVGAAVLLASSWMSARRIAGGGAVMRATMWKPGNPDAPTHLSVNSGGYGSRRVLGNNPVHELEDVDASLAASRAHRDILVSATELSLGFAHQFGQQRLCVLKPLRPEDGDRSRRV